MARKPDTQKEMTNCLPAHGVADAPLLIDVAELARLLTCSRPVCDVRSWLAAPTADDAVLGTVMLQREMDKCLTLVRDSGPAEVFAFTRSWGSAPDPGVWRGMRALWAFA